MPSSTARSTATADDVFALDMPLGFLSTSSDGISNAGEAETLLPDGFHLVYASKTRVLLQSGRRHALLSGTQVFRVLSTLPLLVASYAIAHMLYDAVQAQVWGSVAFLAVLAVFWNTGVVLRLMYIIKTTTLSYTMWEFTVMKDDKNKSSQVNAEHIVVNVFGRRSRAATQVFAQCSNLRAREDGVISFQHQSDLTSFGIDIELESEARQTHVLEFLRKLMPFEKDVESVYSTSMTGVFEFSGVAEDYVAQTCCSICLTDYKIGIRLCSLPCQHHFHVTCATSWLRKNNECPLCHESVTETATPRPVEA